MTTNRSPVGTAPLVTEPLAAILAQHYEPGTNRRGRRLAGALPYVLPDLAPRRVVAFDADPTVVETLRGLAGSVTDVDDLDGDTVRDADVLWIGGVVGSRRLLARAALDDLPATILVGDVEPAAAGELAARLEASGRSTTVLELGRSVGTVRSVRPAAVGVVAGPSSGARPSLRTRLASLLPGGHPPPAIEPGTAILAARDGAQDAPPGWLATLLAPTAIDPAATTWRIDAPGGYASQKVTVRLQARDPAAASAIVKLTQDGRFNARLQREVTALTELGGRADLGPLRVPSLLASGLAGPYQAAVESLEAGRPLPPALREPGGEARVARTVDGVIGLGAATRREASGPAVADALHQLVERYVAIHEPSADVRRRLDGLLAPIAAAARVPIVATHGDLGTHNLLLAPDESIVALDWEAYEPDGLPLWDLWYLLRSATLDLDRSRWPRRRLPVLLDAFLGDGPRNTRIVEATTRYRRAIPVEPALVVPLVALCWIHRALKEAARTDPARVRDGHFATFAAAILDRLDAPGLVRLQAAVDPS